MERITKKKGRNKIYPRSRVAYEIAEDRCSELGRARDPHSQQIFVIETEQDHI